MSVGHRLRFESTGCPQCGEEFHGLDVKIQNVCACDRCETARSVPSEETPR